MSTSPGAELQTRPPRTIARSILSVFAGLVFVIAASLVTDEIFHVLHVFPPWGQSTGSGPFTLATVYRAIFGVIGAYITARLAPFQPMKHAMILGFIGFVLAILGAAATWNRDFGPHWYPIALVVLALPQSWLGGKLFTR
jgi:hypothetical protein